MSRREDNSIGHGMPGRLCRLLAGLAIGAGISFTALGCVNVKVDKGAVQVPGYTWPAEDDQESKDKPDQLP